MPNKALKFVGIKGDNFQFNYAQAGAKQASESFWQGKF